jgi:transcriptional regulator with XRE-family HTH domain
VVSDSPDLDEAGDAAEPVGAALARWRKRKRIPGQALGDLVGMSQAKISRLETGASTPDPADVRLLAQGLELPPAEVERLVELAEHSTDQLIDWRPAHLGLANRQRDVRQLESASREMRIFQPAVVIGLLQTSGYARALMASLQTELADDQIADSAVVVSEAVTARIQRSQVLDDPDRRFHFLMAEAVLSNRVCEPAEMLAQILRIRTVAQQPNVDLRIITQDAKWPIAPYHGFALMDDRYVFVDLFNTSLMSRGRRTIRHYQRAFDALERIGTTEIMPILDRHQDVYARLSLSGTPAGMPS